MPADEKMILKKYPYFYLSVLPVLFIGALGFIFIAGGRYHKELPLTNEKELKVNLEAGYGNITIGKNSSKNIFSVDIEADLQNDLANYFDYSHKDMIGFLNINTTDVIEHQSQDKKKGHSFHISGFESNSWDMHFTDAVPISFDIELGMGKGELDFTGLAVKDLNLSTGASSVVMRFDKPNKSTIENLTIETGLSKFRGYGLFNANFDHLKFQGGVGAYTLDFSGSLEKDVDVGIEVGLGSLTVIIPRNVGVKIFYEKSIISHIDFPADFSERDDNNYISSNYYSNGAKMNMHIEAGLGSIKIIRE